MNELSDAELWVYDEMISVRDAEMVIANPYSTPSQIGNATTILTGSKVKGQTAEAKAILAEASRRKGY